MRRAVSEKQNRQYVNALKYLFLIAADFADLFVTSYCYDAKFYVWVVVKTFS
jgi:hypothetical protein